MADRGRRLERELGPALVTVHPSALLRAPDAAARERATERFVADLIVAREALERSR
ncbi:MAG: hypothetical protein U1F43_07105 [Myxococcota bacterium]